MMKPGELFARIRCLFEGNRPVIYGIKYIPMICTALLTLHVFLLLLGVYEPVTVGLAAVLLVVFMIMLSFRFSFCMLHRSMIVYMGVMTLCICIQKYDGFGNILMFARLAMMVIGVILVVLAILKGKDDGCGEQ